MATSRTPVSKMTTAKKTTSTASAKPPASTAKTIPRARSTSASAGTTPAPRPKQTKLTLETTAATRKPRAAKKAQAEKSVTPEQRHQMVAAAAYFLAERHGFSSGRSLDDWIAAEKEIDGMLKSAA